MQLCGACHSTEQARPAGGTDCRRALLLQVEELFVAQALLVLCTTSTLAVGVNLPAHLVIIKGTRR
jgi:replicative superfamily II helicase